MADRGPVEADDAADDDTVVELWAGPDGVDEVEEEARARQAPYLATGATALTGYACWGVAEMVGALGGPDARSVVTTGACVATAAAVPVVRSLLKHRIPDAWRRRWWLASAAAALWVDGTVAWGPSWELAAGLAIGAAAVSAKWAAEHELPNPGDVVLPEPEPVPAPRLPSPPPIPEIDISRGAQVERDWIARVQGGPNPVAKGARLEQRKRIANGDEWLIVCDPAGTVGATELVTMRPKIARALQMSSASIMVERLDGPDDREDLARLTVVSVDVLADGVPYPGPRYDEGVIPIGLYADGTGVANWLAYDETGPLSGVVAGGQGSGKSTLLAALGLAYRESGEWFVVFGDGDENGRSSKILKRAAHNFGAGPEECLQQLEAIEAWYRYRGVLMGGLTDGPDGDPMAMTDPAVQEPVDWIKPCRNYQGLIWFLDELHRHAQNPMLRKVQFIPRVARIVRITRKLGGAVIIGTQSLNAEDFGGDGALRGMLGSGNFVAMRTGNKGEQHVIGDLQFSQDTLRKGGGYGYGGHRKTMMRTEFSKDMHIWLTGLPGLPASTPDQSAAVFARHRAEKILDPAAEFERRQAAMAEWMTALETGAALPGSEEAKKADEQAATRDEVVSVGGVDIPGVPDNVIPMAPRPAASAAPAPTKPAKVAPMGAYGAGALPAKARQVLDILESGPGPWRTAQLAETAGLSKPDVSKALGELVRRRLAHRPADVQGVYAAGPEPSSATG